MRNGIRLGSGPPAPFTWNLYWGCRGVSLHDSKPYLERVAGASDGIEPPISCPNLLHSPVTYLRTYPPALGLAESRQRCRRDYSGISPHFASRKVRRVVRDVDRAIHQLSGG